MCAACWWYFQKKKVVLSQIKQEYEYFMNQLRKENHGVQALKNKLASMSQDTKEKIQLINENHQSALKQKDEIITNLKNEIKEIKFVTHRQLFLVF